MEFSEDDLLQEGHFVEKLIRNTDSIEEIINQIENQFPHTLENSLQPSERVHFLDDRISKYQRWTRFYNWFICEVKAAVEEEKWDIEGMKDAFLMAESETAWRLIHSLIFKKKSEGIDAVDSPLVEEDVTMLRKNAYDAARDGDVETLKDCIKTALQMKDRECLTTSGGSTSHKSILHMAVFKSYDETLVKDHVSCVKLILRYAQLFKKKNEMLDRVDKLNQTALEIAIENKSEDICTELLSHGADLSCSRKHGTEDDEKCHESKMDGASSNNNLLIQLYLELPGVLEFLFNRDIELKLECNNKRRVSGSGNRINKESKKINLHLNYTHIIGFKDKTLDTNNENVSNAYTSVPSHEIEMESVDKKTKIVPLDDNEMNITFLARIVYAPQFSPSILGHPLVKIFVHQKWNSMKWQLNANFVFQLFFYLLYLGLMLDMYYFKCPRKAASAALPEETTTCTYSSWEIPFVGLLFIFNVVLLVMEIFEFRKLCQLKIPMEEKIGWKIWKFPYFHETENWFQFFFNFFSVATTLPFLLQQTEFSDLQYCLASIGIFNTAILMLFIIGNANISISEYVFVYGKIFKRLAKVLMTFSPIILAFVISFFITFPEMNTFYMTKIFIMLAGEFNFDDDFSSNKPPNKNPNETFHSIVGQTQYVLFGFAVTIIFVNIFLGYAIDDIQELKKVVDETRRKIQIKQLFLMDEFMKRFCCTNKNTAQGSAKQRTNIISLEKLPTEWQTEIRQMKKNLYKGDDA